VSAAPPTAGEIRDYLLRRLPEPRRALLEEQYFRDDAVLERVEEAEDELVSAYVLGRLAPSERASFEASLLDSPYYRDRVETTTQIRLRLNHLDVFRKRKPSAASGLFAGRSGFLIAASFLFVLFLAALVSALRLKGDLEAAKRALAEKTVSSAERVVVLPAFPGGIPGVRISRPIRERLVLVLPRPLFPDGARTWRAVLRLGSRDVWESGPLPAGGPGEGDLALRLPAGQPAPGHYELLAAADGDPAAPHAVATLDVVEPPL
jgi:hypothetical protein